MQSRVSGVCYGGWAAVLAFKPLCKVENDPKCLLVLPAELLYARRIKRGVGQGGRGRPEWGAEGRLASLVLDILCAMAAVRVEAKSDE